MKGQPAGDSALLADRALGLPIVGLKASDIQDTFAQARDGGDRRHEATDILAPRGTPVVAVDTGIITKLFTSKPGGLTIYQFDPPQNVCYYYAHLDRYAEGLREGMLVKKGDVIGYVGTTGNARPNTPHLHFAIFELGPEKHWWEGKPINPYPSSDAGSGKIRRCASTLWCWPRRSGRAPCSKAPSSVQTKTTKTNSAAVRTYHSYANPQEVRVRHVALDLDVLFAREDPARIGNAYPRPGTRGKPLILDSRDLKDLQVEASSDGNTWSPTTFQIGYVRQVLGAP